MLMFQDLRCVDCVDVLGPEMILCCCFQGVMSCCVDGFRA